MELRRNSSPCADDRNRWKRLVADYLALCEQAARAGGDTLLSWMGCFAVREKGPSDLVTEADWASQEAIRHIVSGAFFSHAFLGEENDAPAEPDAEYCWVVDPLDGTTNYVHGVPHFASSVALLHGGRPLVGCVFDPLHDECFTALAAKGHGPTASRSAPAT